MNSRNRPSSAHGFETRQSNSLPTPEQQQVRPKTASNISTRERSSLLKVHQTSTNQHSSYGPNSSVNRPTSAIERTELYKRLLVDSVSRVHCPTLYRALCKLEKAFRDNRKARYACAKMLYLAAVRGEFDSDDIQEHLRNHLSIFVSSAESRQLVLYGGLFSSHNLGTAKIIVDEIKAAPDMDAAAATASAAANAFQEDMRMCVKGMQLSVPPLYCYKKWCKDVKKLESQRYLSSGFFSVSKKHFTNRIGMIGTAYEGSECGGSVTSFEEVMSSDVDGILLSSSSVTLGKGLAMKSIGSDDDEDDYAPLPLQKKASKMSKFKRIAFGIMAALPGDEADMPFKNSPKNRKKGLQYLYQTIEEGPVSPEKQRMIASLIRGEHPIKDKDKPKAALAGGASSSSQDPSIARGDDDDELAPRIGGIGIVASDEIAAGYFNGPRSPPHPSSIPMPGDTSIPGTPPKKRGMPGWSPVSHNDKVPFEMPSSDNISISASRSMDSLDGNGSRRSSACGGIAVLQDRVVIDSVPLSPVSSPGSSGSRKMLAGATARLRKVTIMESSVYSPPVPTQMSQMKLSATIGLAKIRMLSKSSSFNERRSSSFESTGGVAKPADEKELVALTLEIPSTGEALVLSSPAAGHRKSPLRPTMALPRGLSGRALVGDGKGVDGSSTSAVVDDDYTSSPTLNILNGFSAPFAG